MKALVVIPARYASTRFPGKPLALISGRSLIERVYERCLKAKGVSDVIVATDHARIVAEVERFGGHAVMTNPAHRSGTDRVAEVARRKRASLVVNVQGDEPLIPSQAITGLIEGMIESGAEVGTLAHPIESRNEFLDPNVVKVVLDRRGFALYFSRAPIPMDRDGKTSRRWVPVPAYRHIGVYAYRAATLQKWVVWRRTTLERLEALEQLRALENGVQIRVFLTRYRAIGVDVPSDVEKVERLLAKARRGR
ncbi:MAG: 3-deoxy-manno-octulosonate cytidylyltransferase [Verrucomicrobiae bacterium]|nr:3-deoxy-manno-octulosonate cytidylyltransferase [Verrucomicrobiae bacterium]